MRRKKATRSLSLSLSLLVLPFIFFLLQKKQEKTKGKKEKIYSRQKLFLPFSSLVPLSLSHPPRSRRSSNQFFPRDKERKKTDEEFKGVFPSFSSIARGREKEKEKKKERRKKERWKKKKEERASPLPPLLFLSPSLSPRLFLSVCFRERSDSHTHAHSRIFVFLSFEISLGGSLRHFFVICIKKANLGSKKSGGRNPPTFYASPAASPKSASPTASPASPASSASAWKSERRRRAG